MGFREATPGLVINLACVILLALVSFNTPLIKSLYFLQASYGDSATATFGTMGYCIGGTCTGPTVGYQFDINTIFGVSGVNIPTVVSKYLTYVLVLHIAALVCSFLALVCGGLSHIRGFAMLCFPSLFSYLASALTLAAFVLDCIMWYIARARVNSISGASASIGICVWLTLAAWILTAVGGCFYSFGRTCLGHRRRDQEEARRRDRDDYQNVPGGSVSGKRAGPPVREQEVSIPLTAAHADEDKYLEDESDGHGRGVPYGAGGQGVNGQSLGRNGSVVSGVGMGYGRRQDPSAYGYPPNQAGGYRTGSPATTAGSFAGVGVRSGAVHGAPGYIPGGRLAESAGMAGAGAGAAAIAGTAGYGPGQHDRDVTEQYDPYNQHTYGADQQQGYSDPYNQHQTQYPQTSQSPPLPARSPQGYTQYGQQAAAYDPYASNQQSYGVPYTTSYSNPAPAAALAAAASGPYASSQSPPLTSPVSRTSWQQQDPYGGINTGAASMPLPAPHAQWPQDRSTAFGLDEGYENIIANAQAGHQPQDQYQQGQSSHGHYGSYNDQAHPTDDDGDHNGPRPPSYDSAAGTYQNHDQGGSSRQQAWPSAANEKSAR